VCFLTLEKVDCGETAEPGWILCLGKQHTGLKADNDLEKTLEGTVKSLTSDPSRRRAAKSTSASGLNEKLNG